ncbi:uncharacterized protein LOC120084022 [Benincasa hispida]|uniref:uncharacterized protein LOC120084022 n=1 Tax=Benincasa hispida TaxID=102211 RepID=UPI0019018B65|nr:uncharacterized protein LOC120084022 [Benincasa hispida]
MPRQRGRLSKQTGGRNTNPTNRGPEVGKNPPGGKKKVNDPVGQEMMSEGESSAPRIVQRLAASVGSVRANPEKKYGIERFKALEAVTFKGTTNSAEAELWLDVVEKCFNVMSCPEDRKVGLATFLLQKEAEKWWKVISTRRASTDAMLWPEFRKAFEDKYYPSSFRDAKRDEFLRLTQGTMSVAEYEQKFTELS